MNVNDTQLEYFKVLALKLKSFSSLVPPTGCAELKQTEFLCFVSLFFFI